MPLIQVRHDHRAVERHVHSENVIADPHAPLTPVMLGAIADTVAAFV